MAPTGKDTRPVFPNFVTDSKNLMNGNAGLTWENIVGVRDATRELKGALNDSFFGKTMAANKFHAPNFAYPANLGSVLGGEEPFFIVNVISSVAVAPKVLCSIGLYMPTGITVSYGTSYKPEAMSVDQFVSGALGLWHNRRNTAFRAGAKALEIAPGLDMSNAMLKQEQLSGMIVNPHMANLFQGVSFRKFEFIFDMMPKNKLESIQIRHIINQFKYHMHPSIKLSESNKWMHYPNNFIIGLFSPADDYMFKISTCALTKLQVDYGPGNQSTAFFADTGAPVAVKMTLGFDELELMTQERVDEGY